MQQSDLSQFHGTESYTRWNVIKQDLLTDGALFVAEKAEAFWLFDSIAIHVGSLNEAMVVSTLTVSEDGSAILALRGPDENVLASEVIPYTDFPLAEITIWSIQDDDRERFIHLLPSEY